MQLSNLFRLSYYFSTEVNPTFPYFWWVVGVLVGIFILSLIFNIRSGGFKPRVKSYLVSRLGRDGMIASLLLLFWLFVRYQSAPYFSCRVWPLIIVFSFLVEGGWMLWFFKKVYPKRLRVFEERKKEEVFVRRGKKRRR